MNGSCLVQSRANNKFKILKKLLILYHWCVKYLESNLLAICLHKIIPNVKRIKKKKLPYHKLT